MAAHDVEKSNDGDEDEHHHATPALQTPCVNEGSVCTVHVDGNSSSEQEAENLKDIAKKVAMYGGGAVLAVGAVTLALPAAGFTAGGVAAGSLAASAQSAGLAGSVFAALQSAGAAGLSLSTQTLIGITGAGIAGTVDKLMGRAKQTEQEKLKEWMTEQVKLPEYYELFVQNGFDRLEFVKMVEDHDLAAMGITKCGHRKQLLRHIALLRHNK
eukprot:CAMPEP_0197027102 /NCGR_PEP_ID=MMETSP1384-20130603/7079_1 /TAXON_ID=29189 /ORGANISM="Ammonia sp." /LENGTH=212 /DNA_ID=CAMNT_0042455899 /DNA_START=71 /DNA_END=709 /DNA_ORIENTATION=+